MTLTLVFLGLMCLLPSQGMEFSQRIMDKVNLYNLYANCWGDKAMEGFAYETEQAKVKCGVTTANEVNPLPATLPLTQPNVVFRQMPLYHGVQSNYYNPYVALGRKKRMAEHKYSDAVSAADMVAFKEKMDVMAGKLMCVLQEIGLLDTFGNIKSPDQLQDQFDGHKDTPAGSDPAFINKYQDEMANCYNIAMSFPAAALDQNEFMRSHGRHMVYFKCLRQCEIDMCVKYQMVGYLEATSGKPLDPAMFGAKDKYDAAAMAAKIMETTGSDVEKHIDSFFWGTPDTMFDM